MSEEDAITLGTWVLATDASGVEHRMQALTGVEVEGHTFPVIWVNCPRHDGGYDRMPWPAESVRRA